MFSLRFILASAKRACGLAGIALLTVAGIPAHAHAVGTCTPGLSTVIGTEYVADKCSAAGPPYNYIATDLTCAGGKVVKSSSQISGSYYNKTPDSFQSALASLASWYGMQVFRNTDGTRFITISKYFKQGGTLEGVNLGQYTTAPTVHVDVFADYYFPPASVPDADNDGFYVCLDCNDNDPAVNPAAQEICGDGLDNDCNNVTDCADAPCATQPQCLAACTDNDGDGFSPDGEKCGPVDCNDSEQLAHPGLAEICGDGINNDCDATTPDDCCDTKIIDFTGSNATINAVAGGATTFNATITDSSGKGINWTMNVAGRIFTGTGKSISVLWDGKDSSGRILDSGTYTATLHAETGDGGCKDDATLPVRISNSGGCLTITFGSRANIANGNLSHDQELFSTGGTGLSTAMTLYYNSLSQHLGSLGLGWAHSYEINVTENADGSVLLRSPNSAGKLYNLVDGAYVAPAGDYATLVKNSDNTFTRATKAGLQYRFNQAGNLAAIVDRNGNAMQFAYEYGMLTSITDSVGRVTEFLYELNGRLAQITDPDGKNYNFLVEGDTLAKVTMPDGGNWLYTYDAEGFLVSRTDASGYTTTYTYDEQHRVKTATDPEGKSRSITYSTSTDEVKTALITEKDGSVWQFTFDSTQGNMLAKTDPAGNSITYTYDENHNLLSKTEADGSTTTYGYDANGNMLWTIDPLGNKTTYTYNEAGQVTSITDASGDTTDFSYDGKGNLLSVRDAAGNTTQYTYDASGRISSITNQAGQTITLAYDTLGNVAVVTDPAGAKTSMTYDAAGRVINQTDANGQTTTFGYDEAGNLITVVDPFGQTTTFGYDQNGNRTAVTDANGNTTAYVYDYAHRVVQITDALGQTTSLTYAETGCATCGAGQKTQPATLTDANGHTTWFQYDSMGRLVEESNQLGAKVTYQYDAKGNLISRTDAQGRTTSYSYDAMGRLLAKVFPDQNQVLFKYDAKGRLIYAANQHIGYGMTYDNLGRLITITDSNQRTIRYQYDALGNRTKMTTPEGKVVEYSYDEANRLIGIDSFLGEFSFGYDKLGRRVGLAFPNGVSTGYTYDAVGRLTEILAQTAGRRGRGETVNAFSYTHDAVGNRLSKTVSMDDFSHRDTRYEYTYDAVYQLLQSLPAKNMRHREWSQEQRAERFSYDPVGNRLTGPDRRDTYRYNDLNELLSARRTAFQYDLDGNMIAKGGWTYEYDYENRLVKAIRAERDGIKTVSFKYDPFGRRIEKKVEEVEDGRLESKTYAYVYDNEDIILEIKSGGKDEDGDNDGGRKAGWLKHWQKRVAKPAISRFVHGPGIDEPLAMEQKGRAYFYHADGLGSIVSLTDAKGHVVQSYQYDSFGNMQHHGGEVKQPYAYTAREWDHETGLYFYRARYYDPQAGRFISKDPIGFAGGDVNVYRYVGNDPVNWVDPLGLDATNWFNTTGGRSWFNGPTNGNWGGSCWSGGRYSCNGNPIGDAPPTDSGDQCYKQHDTCLSACGSNLQCRAACNRQVVDNLLQLPNDSRLWPHPPRAGTEGDSERYRFWAIELFGGRQR
ncbi:RHS repeat-associated core domain-containing protein [Thiovibrio sp. JS02]